MNTIIIAENNQDKINRLFSKEETLGLYFNVSSGSLYGLQTSDFLSFNDANSNGLKKVQLFTDGEVIEFDDFHPKSNLEYSVSTIGEGQIIFYYSEPELDYQGCVQIAMSLMEKGEKVLIAERHNKSRNICAKEYPIQPFSKERSEGNIFLHHTRTEIFSSLITKEDNDGLDLNDLNRWMSAGHSNLITSKRVAIFDCGNPTNFGKVDKVAKHDVYTRKELISSFANYSEALGYCKEQNEKSRLGCEFLICESLNHMSWH